jgi:hypothetical protein
MLWPELRTARTVRTAHTVPTEFIMTVAAPFLGVKGAGDFVF